MRQAVIGSYACTVHRRAAGLFGLLAVVSGAAGQAGLCQMEKVLADDGTAGQSLGSSVSISDDVAVISVAKDDDLGTSSGSAFVYRSNGSNWVQEQKLLHPDGAPHDFFGNSVSVSSDVLVVGAPSDDDNGSSSGSAHIYRFNGSNWAYEQMLLANDAAEGDLFGVGVSVSGDVAVIGAYLDDDLGTDSGSAYVFRFNGSMWIQEHKLLAADGAAGDEFGRFLSVSGNVVVIGAHLDDDSGTDSGSAYVFRFNGSAWIQEQKLLAADGAVGDFFGDSVSLSGDVAVVGAEQDGDHGTKSGSAYVYRFNGLLWVQEQKLLASDGAAEDRFGATVAISGDTAVIGALRGDVDPFSNTGAAYVYRSNGSTWIEEQKLLASDGESSDLFAVVAVSGAVAVVAAPGDNDLGFASGSAYFFGGLSDCNGNGVLDCHELNDGTSSDINGNYVLDDCECVADSNGDTAVDVIDLLGVLGAWGPNPDHPADINNDGVVNVSDLLAILAAWGPCPPLS